ncbi:uncharacterized protein UV8b_05541 [Ustilaginoidea virens]|uniref:Uncharacterized protein n=1 Tax=Ustilaginoidea virens TaxID=1159556 RepID=A0A8E5HTL2_USTVR|nr:uncharacterized protein UV8b_05541 [Ustilaginoidea virens]QUC21298.1 hypothetical protein UV8b_05541 [Ustilaginoidea virens]
MAYELALRHQQSKTRGRKQVYGYPTLVYIYHLRSRPKFSLISNMKVASMLAILTLSSLGLADSVICPPGQRRENSQCVTIPAGEPGSTIARRQCPPDCCIPPC